MLEKFEVLAVVENVEELFVLTRAEEIGAKAGATAYHLPELGFRAHQLEEDQVHHFRDVDSGIEHVNGQSNVRNLVGNREIVDQRLGILRIEGYHPGEGAFQVRVVFVEAFLNELGVSLILGEDDGFAEPITTRHLLAFLHQVLQNLIDRVFIE